MDIIDQIYLLFAKAGFEKIIVDEQLLFHKNNWYHRVTFVKGLNSYIIELSEGMENVTQNRFEDSDIYPLSLNENLLSTIYNDLVQYYSQDDNSDNYHRI